MNRRMTDIETVRLFWSFDPPLQAGSELLCPSCETWSLATDWKFGETAPDPTGKEPHVTIICPGCGVSFDYVSADVFKTRLPDIPQNVESLLE
jgi:hypothetical protein